MDTRTARAGMAKRKKPYFRLIGSGLHLGYYRGAKGGAWQVRRYLGKGSYETHTLGLADDRADADGVSILHFGQAQAAAQAWAAKAARRDAGEPDAAPITVRQAVDAYLADYSARGGKARSFVEGTFTAHVLPWLGERLVTKLTTEGLKHWHHSLAAAPARLRTKAAATKQNARPAPATADEERARRSTANNVLTLLRAALNLAFRDGKVPSDHAWRRVQPFKKVDAARIRYLSDDEANRLMNACPVDLRAIVTAALLTGCRYAELAALRPMDVDAKARIIGIPETKSGTARTIVLVDEAIAFFETATAGRPRAKPFLLRSDGSTWAKSFQFRPMRAACEAANITPAVGFHILRHTHASRLAMAGVPMAVIAQQLGHSDTKVTEKHYAHLSPGYVSDTIRDAFLPFGITSSNAVTPMIKSG
jgi:integrase